MKEQQLSKIGLALALLGSACGGRATETPTEQGTAFGGAPSEYAGASAGASALGPAKGGTGASAPRPDKSKSPTATSHPPGEAGAPNVEMAGDSGWAGTPSVDSAGTTGWAGTPSAGTAGSTGSAGSTGTAGSPSVCVNGESGAVSEPSGDAGEAGFSEAPQCAGLTFVPSSPLITGAFDSIAFPGLIYAYTAPGLAPASAEALTASDGTFAGIAVSAAPGVETDPMNRWLGIGLPVKGCIDASAYRGVKFTITGDLGNCALSFGLATSADNSDSFAGSCHASSCYGPSSGPLQVGTSVVLFSEMSGGQPESRVNPATLNDLQWQLVIPCADAAPACVAAFTITDVSFVGP